MADTQPRGFLSLPYEIREMIYKFLFVSDQWIIVERKSVRPRNAPSPECYNLYCYKLPKIWDGEPETSWSAQFLRVCKRFHGEASQFMYGHNKFELSLETLRTMFLPTIGDRNASFIRYMEIARTELGAFKATYAIPTVLQAFPNLRCVYFTPIIKTNCGNECQYFCKHTPSHLKILVLRLAHLITNDHPHLKWLLEFKHDAYSSPNNMWYKLSDDESNKHPSRPHENPNRHAPHPHPRPRLEYEVAGEVVDIEQQLTRVKVVRVKTGRIERPAWRV